MAAGNYLELVKLQPEDPASMLHQSPDTECTSGGPGIHGGLQIPHLDFPIVGPADNSLTVKPYTPDELLVPLQGPEAGPALDVPEPDGVVRTAAHHQPVVVLQTCDTPLVTIEGSYKFTRVS